MREGVSRKASQHQVPTSMLAIIIDVLTRKI
jgi:hypothetical protein